MSVDFDWQFYTQFYEDLNHLKDYTEAYSHWSNYGINEGRYPSLDSICKSEIGVSLSELPSDFNAEQYIHLNPDIEIFCTNRYKTLWHYMAYGRQEDRPYSSRYLLKKPDKDLSQAVKGTEPAQRTEDSEHSREHNSSEYQPSHLEAAVKSQAVSSSDNFRNQAFRQASSSTDSPTVVPSQTNRDVTTAKTKSGAHKTGAKSEKVKERPSSNVKRTGRIDFCKDGLVRGWALPLEGDRFATLDLYIDNIFFKSFRADMPRKDLLKHNLGHGRNGFDVKVPEAWLATSSQTIDIKFGGTQESLRNSPSKIGLSEERISRTKNERLDRTSHTYKNLAFGKKTRAIAIVIPIFNAYEEVGQCIESVIKHTTVDAKLLLINDCSTDERIVPMLNSAASYPNIEAVHNPENLGYTATINKGIEIAKRDDIVLLNSDTRVGPQWLQNLQRAAYQDVDVATATAISDNSGAFSVPNLGVANDMPLWLSSTEMVRAVSQRSDRIYPEVPTGSGFCIYIRRELFDDIGYFDAGAFPRGYGEENDFCMRAIRAGWRHTLDDSTLVYHVRSASFKEEKKTLIKQGREVVDQRYPEYKTLTPTYSQSLDLQFIRYKIRRLIEGRNEITNRVLPRVLYVISTRTGGTPQTNKDLMSGLKDHYHTFLLHCDGEQISLYDTSAEPHQLCESIKLKTPIAATTHRSDEYEKAISSILVTYSIELLHIRHIVWHSIALPRVAKQLGIPVIFSLHDFYTICPTVNLLDEKRDFCGGRCTSSTGECSVPIWKHIPPLKHKFIHTWQRMMSETMAFVDAFVTTSQSAKDRLCTIYPELGNANFPVIPHGRDFLQMKQGVTLPEQSIRPSQPLRILFPGNISLHKGAEIIAELYQKDIDKRLEIHFLGTTDPVLKSVGHHHGAYKRHQFFDLIQKIRPHYVGIFSIWPETYCHTLTEAWASGVPVIALDQGAVGERVRDHKGGWLLESSDARFVYRKLLEIAQDKAGYSQRMNEVRRWQQTYGRQNSISTMSAHYHELYQKVMDSARPFRKGSFTKRMKVGVFVHRDAQGKSNPSAHVRVLDWLKHPLISRKIDAQFLDVDDFLQDESNLFEIDLVLVQRNIIRPYLTEQFVKTCQQRDLPIIYEIDDDLLNVPKEKDTDGAYARTAISIERMLEAATNVVVSTQPLQEKVQQYSHKVHLIPNTLPEFLWLRPRESTGHNIRDLLNKNKKVFKVLYMGSPTHSEDLAMIKPVFMRLARENRPIKLFVIGGERSKASEEWYQKVAIPPVCRHYPDFVQWLRNVAVYFDMAIAPLVESDFNRSKSALKYVQYSAMTTPAIYSNCEPYNQVVEDGVNGFLTENSEQDWYKKIMDCYKVRSQLKEIGEAAREDVINKHLMNHYCSDYVSIFEDAVSSRTQQV